MRQWKLMYYLPAVVLLVISWCVVSGGRLEASECPWPVSGAGRVYLGPGAPYSICLPVSGDALYAVTNSVAVSGSWVVLPAGDYIVRNASSNVVYTGSVVAGHSYFVSVAEGGGAVLWSDADEDRFSTQWFWCGFSLIAVTGLLGKSAVWVNRIITGGGVNE